MASSNPNELKVISSSEALMATLTSDLTDITLDVAEIVHTALVSNIWNEVYAVYDPSKYPRQMDNGGLLGAWEYDLKPDGLSSEIYYDPNTMRYEPDSPLESMKYVHGNPDTDRRDSLPEYIIKGTNYDFGHAEDEGEEEDSGNEDDLVGVSNPFNFFEGTYQAELPKKATNFVMPEGKKWYNEPRDFWTPTLKNLEEGSVDDEVLLLLKKSWPRIFATSWNNAARQLRMDL